MPSRDAQGMAQKEQGQAAGMREIFFLIYII
jgi:hypothetical protein